MVVVAGKGDELVTAAEQLAAELSAQGVQVLLDDRKVSPGVKFADNELLGMPTAVIIWRALADGEVESRDRASGSARRVPVARATNEVLAEIGRAAG